MKSSNITILILRLAIGALFLQSGLDKYHEGWLNTSEPLRQSLAEYHQHAAGAQLIYLDHVAIPYAGIWARLMTVGELAVAVSLLLGLLVRCSSFIAIFMVLNFHTANGKLFSFDFFSSPWSAVLVAGLLLLMLARAGRWAGIDALLAKSNAKGLFW